MELEGLVQRLEGDTSGYVQAMNYARQSLDLFMKSGERTGDSLDLVKAAFDTVEMAAGHAGKAMREFTRTTKEAADRTEAEMMKVQRAMFGAAAATQSQVNAVKQLLAVSQQMSSGNLAEALPNLPFNFIPTGVMGGSAAAKARAFGFGPGNFPPTYGPNLPTAAEVAAMSPAQRAAFLGEKTGASAAQVAFIRNLAGTGTTGATADQMMQVFGRTSRLPPPLPPGYANQALGMTTGASAAQLAAMRAAGIIPPPPGLPPTVRRAPPGPPPPPPGSSMADRAVSGIGDRISGMFSMNSLAGMVLTVTGITAALWAMRTALNAVHEGISYVVTKGMEMERMRTTFQVLTGSRDRGNALFGDIQQYALKSPFTTQQLAGSAQTLLGMGVKEGSVLTVLQRLGDVAGGDADRLRNLALAFGEVEAEGKMSGMRLRQFATAGVGLEDFAKAAGMSSQQFRKAMHNNEVDINVVIRAINQLTDTGGRFAGMTQATMTTVYGQWSNFKELIEITAGKLGEAVFKKFDVAGMIEGAANSVQMGAPDFIQNVLDLLDKVAIAFRMIGDVGVAAWESVGGAYAKFREAIGGVLPTVEDFKGTMNEVVKVMLNLGEVAVNVGATIVESVVLAMIQLAKAAKDLSDLKENMGPKGLLKFAMEWSPIAMAGRAGGALIEHDRTTVAMAAAKKAGDTEEYERLRKQLGGGVEETPEMQAHKIGSAVRQLVTDVFQGTRDRLKEVGSRPSLFGPRPFAGFGTEHFVGPPALEDMMVGPPALKGPPKIPERMKWFDQDVVDAAAKFEKHMKEGLTPFDKFETEIRRIRQAHFGKETPEGFVGPPVGLLIDDKTRRLAESASYEELRKSLGGIMDKGEHLPGLAGFGTTEAADAINKAQQDTQSVMEEVSETLKAANELHKLQVDRQEKVADAIDRLAAGGGL